MVEGAAGDAWGGRAEGLVGVTRWMLVVLFLAAPPDVPGRVVAGRVRRQENRG